MHCSTNLKKLLMHTLFKSNNCLYCAIKHAGLNGKQQQGPDNITNHWKSSHCCHMILKGSCMYGPRTPQPHLIQCFHDYEDMSFILMLSTGYSVRTKRSSQVNLATYQLEQPLMLALHILQNLTSTCAAIRVFRYVMTTVYDLILTS